MIDKIIPKINKNNAQEIYEELLASAKDIYGNQFSPELKHKDLSGVQKVLSPQEYKDLCVFLVDKWDCK